MTLGTYNRHQAEKKKHAALAAAFPQGIRCQKCLEYGHWSYECKGKRKVLVRPSRTQVMKKNLKAGDKKKAKDEGDCSNGKCNIPRKKKKGNSDCSDCSDSSDSSSGSSGSDSGSGSSDSDSSSSGSDSDSDSSESGSGSE